MKKMSRSSPALSRNGKDDSSLEDYEDPLLDVVEDDALIRHQEGSAPLNASTPCLTGSRPSSSVGTGCEWEEPWMASIANSDSCLVSSSSGASPLTGTSSQGVSPDVPNGRVFSFQNDDKIPDRSLSSISDALQTEKDFMEYVMSFPVGVHNIHRSCCADSKKNSTDASPKVGLDHLDNLCKLMEQLSDLKEANVKLKRRVQYLEDLKTLHEIHREMVGASTICNSGVSEDELQIEGQKASGVSPSRGRSEERSPELLKDDEDFREFVTGLYRSKTTTHVDSRLEQKRESAHRSRNDAKGKARERSKSVGHPGHSKCKKRPSRWSKVKEVLGIEKTESGVTDEQDGTGDSESKKTEDDYARFEVTEHYRTDSKRKSYKDSNMRPRSTILTSISTKNSEIMPDNKTGSLESPNKAQKALAHMEQYEQGCKKSPKTPWGRMKTMIQSRRDCRTQKSESSSSSSRGAHQTKTVNDDHEPSEKNGIRRSTRSRKPSFTLQDVPKRHQGEEKCLTQRNDNNTPQLQAQCIEKSPSRQLHRREGTDQDPTCKQAMISNGECRKKGGGCPVQTPERQNKKTDSLKLLPQGLDKSTAKENSKQLKTNKLITSLLQEPSSSQQVSFIKNPESFVSAIPLRTESRDVDKKISTGSSELQAHSPCASVTVTELLKELQQNLSDDFNRKLEEWQRFRGDNTKPPNTDVERKESFGRFRKFSKPEKKVSTSEKITKAQPNAQKKDLNWLDKELPKVEREILRLSKEKQKFEKRAFRLRRLKEAMTESQKRNEVLVRTSAGEFRFEGISNAFTKKLYEWETKKGVGPELSTIALLDESLNPHEPDVQSRECRSIDKRSIITTSEQNERLSYQKSSSEPDLSSMSTAQKESNGTLTTLRSKSGDTLLATSSNESGLSRSATDLPTEVVSEKTNAKSSDVTSFMDREDNYCSLLEENMFLLDQLKGKEDICSRLQNELDRLDEKCEKANKVHQDELESYKQKLWEIHMSRPRDLQGSLQLISELKTRIEELEKCSDKLKCDREKLEESFKYHSEQQRHLADDLMGRMLELQESGLPAVFSRTGSRRRWKKFLNCDAGSVSRIHELTTKLLQQARDMEEALAERTKQVCHLRWELLHRDMSAVLLQAALHRVTCQGPQAALLPTWNMKRIKFKELKAWSIDTTTRRQSENTVVEDWLQERLKQLSLAPYNEWTSIEFNPNDLIDTVHELKKETFHMSTSHTSNVSDSDDRKKTASCSAESENADSDRNYDTGSAFNSRSSSFSSGPGGGLRGSHSDTRLYERSRSLSVRRNSSSSMSCVSGFDASESSSVHDSDKIHHQFLNRGSISWNRKKRNRWPSRENVSSSCSSHSSGLEDENAWEHDRDKTTEYDETMSRRLKYERIREADEENVDFNDSYSNNRNQCLITPKPLHLGSCMPGTNSRQNGPTYSLLKTLISHPSYTRAETSSRNSVDSASERDTTAPADYLEQCALQGSSKSGAYNKTIGQQDSSLIFHSQVPEMAEATSHNSSTYTSAESLENCNYVTHREQQLFLDIRNLAISCETDLRDDEKKVDSYNCAENSDVSRENPCMSSSTPMYSITNKAADISQIKYKGTKGFGRPSKLGFRKYDEIDGNNANGVEVASDRRPNHRKPDEIN